MIKLLIFSKDNPIQLKILLKSILKNFNGNKVINILYKTNSEEYKKEYIKLIKENIIENINWFEQDKMKDNVIRILSEDKINYTCFLNDNNIIYNSFNINDVINILNEDESILTFSLRLGLNVTYCYNLNCQNIIIPLEKNNLYFKWDWSKHYGDFGYPFSMNGHIFRTKEILKLIKNIRFNDSYSLEESIQIYDNFPKEKMASFINSVSVSYLINKKEEYYNNLNLESMKFDKIESCYKEL